MRSTPTSPHRGFVIETTGLPSGFLGSLERRGLAGLTAETVDGFYIEPRTNLGAIIAAAEAAGITVEAFRAAGTTASWHAGARPSAGTAERLRNRRSATWLPTYPPAC
ncbi:MAG: hypothetical protein HY875_15460 [Chloroflexi bacterium]|nr:hypothetical protein [Chloroflexota bacterium]